MATQPALTAPQRAASDLAALIEAARGRSDAVQWLTRQILVDWAIMERVASEFARLKLDMPPEPILKLVSDRSPRPSAAASPRPHASSPSPRAAAPVDGSTFRAAVVANSMRFMDVQTLTGKAIGDCTADDLFDDADQYDVRARWLADVAAALMKARTSETDTVRRCLPESTLARLWKEAVGNAA